MPVLNAYTVNEGPFNIWTRKTVQMVKVVSSDSPETTSWYTYRRVQLISQLVLSIEPFGYYTYTSGCRPRQRYQLSQICNSGCWPTQSKAVSSFVDQADTAVDRLFMYCRAQLVSLSVSFSVYVLQPTDIAVDSFYKVPDQLAISEWYHSLQWQRLRVSIFMKPY